MSEGKWIVENRWQCSTCGTVNAGREMSCTGCGKPKEQETYDTSGAANAAAVSDSRLLAAAQGGVNWTCAYCSYQQRGAQAACERCGATRTEAPGAGGAPAASPPVATPATAASAPTSSFRLFGCLGVVLLVCGIGGYLFWPKSTTATVRSVAWKVTTRLEQREVRHGQGWREAMPAGARATSCEPRQNGTEPCHPYPCTVPANGQCNPHDCNCQNQCRDLGNGFSECQRVCETCFDTCTVGQASTCYQQCPRTSSWCSFEYDEWNAVTTRERTGTAGAPEMATDLSASGTDQRVAQDTELTVVFENAEGERREYHPDSVGEFQRFEPGQQWTATESVAGGFTPEAPR